MEYFKIYFTMLNLVGILFTKKLIGVQVGRGRRGVAQGVAATTPMQERGIIYTYIMIIYYKLFSVNI
jgi:hypothetical protein